MALTVATGFVVDDAIVMIENIVRYIEQGKDGPEAAEIGAREIGFTVLSLTVSLIAVFLPLLLMPGVTGRLFHEFAWVLSAAVAISMVVSLTLTPMMCAYLLKPDALPEGDDAHERAAKAGKRTLWSRTVDLYARSLDWVFAHQRLTMLVFGISVLVTVAAVHRHPQGPAARAGHRHDHRRGAGRRQHRLQGHGAAHPRRGRRAAQGSGGDRRGRLHRRRLDQPDPEPGPAQHRAQAARRARQPAGRGRAPAEGRRRHPRRGAVPQAGAGHHPGHARVGHRVPVRDVGRGLEGTGHLCRAHDRGHAPAARTGRRRQQPGRQGQRAAPEHRPRQGQSPGRAGADHRRHPVRRLRPAPDLDHLHPAQPVPRGAGGGAEIPQQHRPAQQADRAQQRQRRADRLQCHQLRHGAFGQFGHRHRHRPVQHRHPAGQRQHRAAVEPGQRQGRERAAGDQPPEPAAGGDHLVQPGAGLFAVPGGRRHPRGRDQPQRAGLGAGAVHRQGGRVLGLAGRRGLAAAGRDRGDLHRAGRALRELHPPADHHLHAAAGGRGRACWR